MKCPDCDVEMKTGVLIGNANGIVKLDGKNKLLQFFIKYGRGGGNDTLMIGIHWSFVSAYYCDKCGGIELQEEKSLVRQYKEKLLAKANSKK